jgi:hypothetical protein
VSTQIVIKDEAVLPAKSPSWGDEKRQATVPPYPAARAAIRPGGEKKAESLLKKVFGARRA